MADGLDAFAESALTQLWTSIVDRHDTLEAQEAAAASEHDLFAEELVECFVGRNDAVAELLRLGSHRDGVVVVTGRAGVGKTSLLAAFSQKFAEMHGSACIVTHFVGPIPDSSDIRKALYRMARSVVERHGVTRPLPEDYSELRRRVAVENLRRRESPQIEKEEECEKETECKTQIRFRPARLRTKTMLF